MVHIETMPRSARLDAPGVLHHVMGRGIERRKIFLDDRDRDDFVLRLAGLVKEGSIEIYAWSLLPNHFHLLCKTKKRPLPSSMRRLLTGYAVNFNLRHRRHGHVFQNRYKSIVCQEDAYLAELVRYIHLNLVRAGVVKNLEELNECPWSGHAGLMGMAGREWQSREYVLSYFGGGRRGCGNYFQFMEEGFSLGRKPELVGGGLIRSLGGWSSVVALRKRGEKQAYDQRILGQGEFVERILSEVDEEGKNLFRRGGKKDSLESLGTRVCKDHGVSLKELRSGSRRHGVVGARQELSRVGIMEHGYSGAEIARYLGVTTSCITRPLSSTGKKVS
jgi:putative transposase